jgi:3-deoxy-D-arabino-heptulosonate 7-phosphate (DAHP) synthase
MSPGLASPTGLKLIRSPNHRQQVHRRLVAVCAMAALALGAGIVGALVHPVPASPAAQAAIGPFSYFPTQ